MNKPFSRERKGRRVYSSNTPVVLGVGGTLRLGSCSEQALRLALRAASEHGAVTEIITAAELDFPGYNPETADSIDGAQRLLNAARRADCLIISTPGYHGGMSGLLKNALDYLQGLAEDAQPYLRHKAVGCIVAAAGWQTGVTTLSSLRSTVHALRGWPTPLGVVVNSAMRPFGPGDELLDPKVGNQLTMLGAEVVTFAKAQVKHFARLG
jgi:FMN reductase